VRNRHLRAAEGDFLGHPRGLTFLFTTEMWERFSYYGMRALLVLYMVKYLLLPGHGDVIGLGTVRGVLESMFGPLNVQPFASQIYGLYTGLVYLTALFGGWLADHLLGQRRTVILGAALMAAGRFMMAFEPLFLLALLTLILGNGALGNTIALWADQHTDRSIDFIVWQSEIPVTWFQAFNPFMIFTFTPLIISFWTWQAVRGKEPSTVTKMAHGCFGVALS
jgi:dipeptide/tripeptide permease